MFTNITFNKALNQISLTWTSSAGKTYSVESSETLTSWPTVVNNNVPSGGATTSFIHNLTAAYPAGNPLKLYYRVTEN